MTVKYWSYLINTPKLIVYVKIKKLENKTFIFVNIMMLPATKSEMPRKKH